MAPRTKRISDTMPAVTGDGARQSQRFPMSAEVTFLQPSGITGHAVNANQGGMRVITDQQLAIGQKCVAVVHLDSGDRTHERMEVVWSRRGPTGWEAGLRFC